MPDFYLKDKEESVWTLNERWEPQGHDHFPGPRIPLAVGRQWKTSTGAFEMKDDVTQSMMVAKKKRWKDCEKLPRQSLTGLGFLRYEG